MRQVLSGNPKTGSLRTVHGYAISTKRYALMEGARIIEVKGHGLGYLMSPAASEEPDWMKTAWEYVLRLDNISRDGSDPAWLDYPAMMKSQSLRLLCLGASRVSASHSISCLLQFYGATN